MKGESTTAREREREDTDGGGFVPNKQKQKPDLCARTKLLLDGTKLLLAGEEVARHPVQPPPVQRRVVAPHEPRQRQQHPRLLVADGFVPNPIAGLQNAMPSSAERTSAECVCSRLSQSR